MLVWDLLSHGLSFIKCDIALCVFVVKHYVFWENIMRCEQTVCVWENSIMRFEIHALYCLFKLYFACSHENTQCACWEKHGAL